MTKKAKSEPGAIFYSSVIERRDPESLVPYGNNPKSHPLEQIDRLAGHIADVGFHVPITVDENNVIITGHGRRAAAIKLGMKEVPVIVCDHLTEAQKKKARIADNKLAESPWDNELLKLELEDLQELGVKLPDIGFDDEELSKILSSITELPAALTDEDAVPEPLGKAVTQRGDVWLLGAYYECEKCKKRFEIDEARSLNLECSCDAVRKHG